MTATTIKTRKSAPPSGARQRPTGGRRRPRAREAQGGGLDDLLRSVLAARAEAWATSWASCSSSPRGGGGIGDILGRCSGRRRRACARARAASTRPPAPPARARDAVGQATGQSPEELIAQLKELIANNQLGAGAALGGLGALILGTGAGRSLAGSAVKLGGLALIGGLAYKAYQNYQQGLPPLTGGKPPRSRGCWRRPTGSGFEPDAVTHESAMLLHPRHDRRGRRRRAHRRQGAAEDPGRAAAGRA